MIKYPRVKDDVTHKPTPKCGLLNRLRSTNSIVSAQQYIGVGPCYDTMLHAAPVSYGCLRCGRDTKCINVSSPNQAAADASCMYSSIMFHRHFSPSRFQKGAHWIEIELAAKNQCSYYMYGHWGRWVEIHKHVYWEDDSNNNNNRHARSCWCSLLLHSNTIKMTDAGQVITAYVETTKSIFFV